MLLEAAIILLKALLAFIAIFVVFITYKHFAAIRRLNFYQDQGIESIPGARRFFLGNTIDFKEREDLVKKR